MKIQHRKPAFIGVGLWFLIFLAMVGFAIWRRVEPTVTDSWTTTQIWWVFGIGMGLQTLCFFWGGYHLTEAKGYPNDLLWFGLLGPVTQLLLLTVLLALVDKRPVRLRGNKAKEEETPIESEVMRHDRYRRYARIWVILGLFPVLMALAATLFPPGIMSSRENEHALALTVFGGGYLIMIVGCLWWAKAKSWPDPLVFLAILPLGTIFIPPARTMFLTTPLLLALSIVMMPLILVVVMYVIPDRSGSRERKLWERGRKRRRNAPAPEAIGEKQETPRGS